MFEVQCSQSNVQWSMLNHNGILVIGYWLLVNLISFLILVTAIAPAGATSVPDNFSETSRPPTVARVEVDESLTRMEVPLATVLCLLAIVSVSIWGRKRHWKGLPAGRQRIVAALLLAAGVLSIPFLRISVARPAALVPAMEDEEAVTVLDSLLKNIYHSFDFREEKDIYDGLATSVSGDLLPEIYVQTRKSMEIPQAPGARARMKDVKLEDVEVIRIDDNPLGFLFRTVWVVTGTVNHWGRIHTRENRYEADITVEPEDGAWKVTGLDLRDEERIDPSPRQK